MTSRKSLESLRRGWRSCEVIFDIEQREKEIERLTKEMAKPGFWDESQRAHELIDELNLNKGWLEPWKEIHKAHGDLKVLGDIAEEADWEEIETELAKLKESTEALELRYMLRERDDAGDAILSIHPGAGGTESCDWAGMLLRMYLRWIDNKGFRAETISIQHGEEAGIKDAVLEVKGDYAYGYLKAETGVHRLVRLSPFDAGHRRHTSFASVFVYPEVEEIRVEIDDKDLKIDTFRSSGPGGQHVNKVSSAVRITHIPSGVVATCQSERSQHKNKANAMKVLRARIYQFYKEKEEEKRSGMEKKDIGWGSQIRSYVFHPYNLVKDHRTNLETHQVERVMDGDLDLFIRGYLLFGQAG